MGIGVILKQLIDEKSTNVNELAEKVEVSPQTLYSIIKRDNMKADLDVLFRICETLGVDINIFYAEYQQEFKSSKQPELSSTEQTLLENFRELNEEGQQRLMNSLDDLIYSGRYEKNSINGVDSKKQA